MPDECTDNHEASDRNALAFDSPEERKEFWTAVVQEQVDSGLSAYAFCKQHGLSPSSFHHWKHKDKKHPVPSEAPQPNTVAKEMVESNDANPSAPRFAELKVSNPPKFTATGSIEIRHGDFKMMLQPDCDRDLLRDLLGMFGEISC